MFETISLNIDGAIGCIQLERPDQLNALSARMLDELTNAASWFDQRPEIRVVIVCGQGRAFSAGADLAGFPEPGESSPRAAADAGRIMADAIENMLAVTVARIHGWCVGGGLVLASACDLRVATDNCRFSIPEIDLGIPLAWGGIPRLVREIGPALTKELVMTCREFDASEALNIGFLNRVVAADEIEQATQLLARQIASKPGSAVLATKRHTNAVTAQMVGIDRSWSDADGLIAALLDPECIAARETYLRDKKK